MSVSVLLSNAVFSLWVNSKTFSWFCSSLLVIPKAWTFSSAACKLASKLLFFCSSTTFCCSKPCAARPNSKLVALTWSNSFTKASLWRCNCANCSWWCWCARCCSCSNSFNLASLSARINSYCFKRLRYLVFSSFNLVSRSCLISVLRKLFSRSIRLKRWLVCFKLITSVSKLLISLRNDGIKASCSWCFLESNLYCSIWSVKLCLSCWSCSSCFSKTKFNWLASGRLFCKCCLSVRFSSSKRAKSKLLFWLLNSFCCSSFNSWVRLVFWFCNSSIRSCNTGLWSYWSGFANCSSSWICKAALCFKALSNCSWSRVISKLTVGCTGTTSWTGSSLYSSTPM